MNMTVIPGSGEACLPVCGQLIQDKINFGRKEQMYG